MVAEVQGEALITSQTALKVSRGLRGALIVISFRRQQMQIFSSLTLTPNLAKSNRNLIVFTIF